jgi:hypothetical protein
LRLLEHYRPNSLTPPLLLPEAAELTSTAPAKDSLNTLTKALEPLASVSDCPEAADPNLQVCKSNIRVVPLLRFTMHFGMLYDCAFSMSNGAFLVLQVDELPSGLSKHQETALSSINRKHQPALRAALVNSLYTCLLGLLF